MESEINQLQTEKERLTNDLKESIEQTIELKEQVDASLGADTMVSQLTQRNLELEEMLEKVKEERNDLVSVYVSMHDFSSILILVIELAFISFSTDIQHK